MGEERRMDRNVERDGNSESEKEGEACGTEDGEGKEKGRTEGTRADDKVEEAYEHEYATRRDEEDVGRRRRGGFERGQKRDDLKIDSQSWRDRDPFSEAVGEVGWFRDRVQDLHVDCDRNEVDVES